MAFTAFPQLSKSIRLSDGTQYALVHVDPAPSQPTFLLLHGFPSSSYDWRHQIRALQAGGFGVVAPDLLGYGDTDSPSAREAYSLKNMSDHIAEILRKLGITKVIGVGHDWGSGLLARLYTWHAECLISAIFIAVGYMEPRAGPMDLDALNALTEKLSGYTKFGYWKLFETEGAGKLLDSHPDSIFSLVFPEEPETWRTDLAPIGAAEAWISANKMTPYPTWLTAEEAATQKKILAQKGYTNALHWYKSVIKGDDSAHIAALPEDRKHVDIPTLLILAQKDYIASPEFQKQGTVWLKKTKIEELPCGHWAQLEMPEEVNSLLVEHARGL